MEMLRLTQLRHEEGIYFRVEIKQRMTDRQTDREVIYPSLKELNKF